MGRFLAPLAVLTAFATLANAGIHFTSPKAGDTLEAGDAIKVEWEKKGSGPGPDDLTTYQLFLCAGPNDASDVNTINYDLQVSGNFAKGGSSAQGTTTKTIGGNTKNAYYVKMIATGAKGGTYTVFSDRFSYEGMTASFSPALEQSLKKLDGTSGPATVDSTVKDPANAADDVADDAYDVEYTMQTGATRYAPMQPVPPTKITAKTAKRQYPTSSVEIAKSKLPIPSVQTTLTQSQTHKVSSMKNTVAAAPMPSDDMAKFLRRWQD